MPTIKIESCSKTPNYCALEAIAKAMRNNQLTGEYQHEQTIKVESGRVLKVTERPMDVDCPTCDCEYKVERINAA